MSVTTLSSTALAHRQPNWLVRLFDYKPFLIVMCLAPALGLLAVFLTYPLGLGVWLAFTDTTIGQRGVYIGLENFQYLLKDPLWWNAVFYSVFYTGIATIGKFALGFWLALLLNNHFPLKSLLRAIVLLPWIVPTVLSALAFWWIYDPQFSIISYLLVDVLHIRRMPEMLLDVTVQSVMFVLLFAYVFGGAIAAPGADYKEFLLPGIMVQTMVFSSAIGPQLTLLT